jgi:hypothetical protein
MSSVQTYCENNMFDLLVLSQDTTNYKPYEISFKCVLYNLDTPQDTLLTKLKSMYEKNLVLVRPDGHVCWRSNEMPNDIEQLLNRVRGF